MRQAGAGRTAAQQRENGTYGACRCPANGRSRCRCWLAPLLQTWLIGVPCSSCAPWADGARAALAVMGNTGTNVTAAARDTPVTRYGPNGLTGDWRGWLNGLDHGGGSLCLSACCTPCGALVRHPVVSRCRLKRGDGEGCSAESARAADAHEGGAVVAASADLASAHEGLGVLAGCGSFDDVDPAG